MGDEDEEASLAGVQYQDDVEESSPTLAAHRSRTLILPA